MWSAGVILYILLCGFPPFYEEELPALFDQILHARYDFPSPWWDDISADGKDLVKKLLELDVKKRLTAAQVLAHPWMGAAPTVALDGAQKALKKYNASRKLKKVAGAIVAQKRMERALPASNSPRSDRPGAARDATRAAWDGAGRTCMLRVAPSLI